MLDDIVMDAALQAHNEVSRGRAICETCKTRCNAVHVPGSSKQPEAASRAGTPSVNGSANGAPGTPGSTTARDGSVILECMHCQRQMASNRFAPHLEKCLGLSSSRRTTNRGIAKSKQSDAGRSNSPASEAGIVSDDNSSKEKMKSKSKRAEEAEFNLKRKRQVSPQVSPNKKKAKTGSPLGRPPKAESPFPNVLGSQSKIPSKLRDSSTAPHLDGASPSSSRSSSPDSGATPLAAALSPTFRSKIQNQRVAKRPSPPRPPPMSAFLHTHEDAGDETGSSTDTDSG
ncbi:hypothetical protein VNI00_001908 [Paramarasmius palmivorus]|uniref:SAGA-associated factor 11 n=1 Tax=Paramarasmius palmivorus TaxID=297713 RepID=A0AAW0E3H5_9AGAR